MSSDRDEVTDATRQAEAEEARAPHDAGDTGPGTEEEDNERSADAGVREHYREMTELGANDPGEGRIP
jgi:hypothetical protein